MNNLWQNYKKSWLFKQYFLTLREDPLTYDLGRKT